MRAILLMSIMALVPAATAQAGPKDDAEARAALELSLALSKPKAVAAHPSKRLSFAVAYERSISTGKPVLLHVANFDCADVCKECADCLHADAPEVKGDKTPRLIVAYPLPSKWLAVQREFRDPPTLKDVRAELAAIEAARIKRAVITIDDCPQGR